jgi:hypothetical protein
VLEAQIQGATRTKVLVHEFRCDELDLGGAPFRAHIFVDYSCPDPLDKIMTLDASQSDPIILP